LAAFLLFTGEKAVRDVTRDDLKSCREVLDQLPDRFELRFKTKDMRTAIEKNGQRKTPQASIGPTTVDLKWLGPVNLLFQWLVLEEKVEKNPVDGIRSKQDAGDAANTKRLPFKPDQISKLFAITSTDLPKTALYWSPCYY
jgi:site-specific recombinase XerC